MNAGQLETETELKRLEAELEKTYKQARDEIQKKLDDYLKKFKVQEKEWRKKFDSGEITEERFKKWYQGKVMNAKRWAAMRDTLAEDLTNVNVMANDLVRDSMLHTFAINHNYGTYEIEDGLSINTSYTLYDRDTVANLIKNDPDILKRPSLDRNLDKRWNKKLFQSHITQGVLQGESIDNLAKRVALGTTKQAMNAAIRNARTATWESSYIKYGLRRSIAEHEAVTGIWTARKSRLLRANRLNFQMGCGILPTLTVERKRCGIAAAHL